jgi:hypothetical protein
MSSVFRPEFIPREMCGLRWQRLFGAPAVQANGVE